MKNAFEKIRTMRDQQLTRGMRAAAILGFFTLTGSVYKIWSSGWHNIMLLHISLYLLVLGVVLLHRRLSYTVRAAAMASVAFLVGLGSLIAWGFGAFSLLALFCACVLFTIFFGARAGIICSIICISVIGIIGALVYAGLHSYDYDAMEHLNSPALWLSAMFGVSLAAALIVVVLGTLNRQVEALVEALETRNQELVEKKSLLENEIAEHNRAEQERKRLEGMLQLARKMESIGKLAGGVAHDLNNTLGSIVGYPDLLLEELPGQSPLRDTIVTIKKSGIKAAAIVNDMLTLARSGIAAPEVIDCNAVISDYLSGPEFQQLKSFHQKVDVDVCLAPEPLKVKGSFFHLSKILMNLLSNSAEAMPGGGRIGLSAQKRTVVEPLAMVENFQEGEYAVLTISDAGTGIPAEDLERIFEPFYTKKSMGRSGTGLGMSVVWGAVKDHNGHISVESNEGQGTKFTVYLPLTTEPLPDRKTDPVKTPRGRGESVLVIDDVKEQRDMARRVLEKMGYSVHAVASGEEAIEYLKSASADLLVLDMLMEPGIDGLETYRRVLEMHPRQKAIIATGYSETSRVKEAQRLGARGYLKKPYSLDQIGRAVRTELDR